MQLKKQKIYLILSFCGNFSGLRQEEASDVVFIHLVGVVGSNPAARDIFSLHTEPYCISKKCSREDIKSLNKIGQDFLYIQHISENEDKLY